MICIPWWTLLFLPYIAFIFLARHINGKEPVSDKDLKFILMFFLCAPITIWILLLAMLLIKYEENISKGVKSTQKKFFNFLRFIFCK